MSGVGVKATLGLRGVLLLRAARGETLSLDLVNSILLACIRGTNGSSDVGLMESLISSDVGLMADG